VEDAVDYLKQIAGKEGLAYEEDALHVIAQKADGAMRDALSIFDQVVSFSKEKITYQDVISNLNILDYEYFFKLTFSLLEGDVASAMLLFNEILAKGFDARNFINGYAAHLRDLMVCKNPETVQLMEVGAGIREKYLSQSAEVSLPFLYEGLDICNQADIQFRSSRNQRLTIELALVKLANLPEVSKKKTVTEAPAQKVEPVAPAVRAEPGPVPENPSLQPSASTPRQQENGVLRTVRTRSISIKDSLKSSSLPDMPVAACQPESGDQEELPEEYKVVTDPEAIIRAWKDYAVSLEKKKPRIYSTLVNNKPQVRADGSVMVLLNSEAQRDNFIRNIRPGLVSYIKEATEFTDVEIFTEVSENKENEKKIYTEQDKMDFLLKKNPELGKLKARFNLDFDD
jgi:DNA polymerase-3 subunit gamma/tau